MAKKRNHQSAKDSLSKDGGDLLADSGPSEREDRVSLDAQIRMRAYELYLDRGAALNDDLGDWLRAEREFREDSPQKSTVL